MPVIPGAVLTTEPAQVFPEMFRLLVTSVGNSISEPLRSETRDRRKKFGGWFQFSGLLALIGRPEKNCFEEIGNPEQNVTTCLKCPSSRRTDRTKTYKLVILKVCYMTNFKLWVDFFIRKNVFVATYKCHFDEFTNFLHQRNILLAQGHSKLPMRLGLIVEIATAWSLLEGSGGS